MGRKCSKCGTIGHNSRTCKGSGRRRISCGSMKLFGVELSSSCADLGFRKSFSLDCLIPPRLSSSSFIHTDDFDMGSGYLSDGLIIRAHQESKKGVPWTEEEHRIFLVGLEKLGKGDWKGISRDFVTSRSPTQVASHAQKYFLRQNNFNNKKRKSTLFDAVAKREATLRQVERNKSSISGDSFTKSSRELRYIRFSNSDISSQSSPSLELTLAAPEPLFYSSQSTNNIVTAGTITVV